ncbi:1-aminocyclopropane-1-carboxylate deaminase/D-cysteine desulfhydrase [Spartinivicinus poritis]|uniref:Pyridoxal-phosphate dependent enzyme n=1 Tax=Spartinivicinus poritis TaxID=2994640 RepID=A0ABT5UF46_9GAMM|nr:pyridoxal-phosphate dependent enzyme [Spartinivicinus sp. A2-2]MDE1465007.1 pyridoxal-phosphate dependent enzyme [Spartinivicinus sp. A2-2]
MSDQWQALTTTVAKPQLQAVNYPLFEQMNVQVSILRLDAVHSLLSGNKWYKLKNNLQIALQQGYQSLASFGGAHSNHIHALAAAGKLLKTRTVGFIRGYVSQPLTPTLLDAAEWGMQLHYLNRLDYQRRYEQEYWQELMAYFSLAKPVYWIPEGGSNLPGVQGCQDILLEVPSYQQFDTIVAACGTGATLAGIISVAKPHQKVLGVPVLKAEQWLQQAIQDWLTKLDTQGAQWQLLSNFHEGGYAKLSAELVAFMDNFTQTTNIPLDPVYTAKMMKAVVEEVKNKKIASGSRVLVVHTGGLQGCRGMEQQVAQTLHQVSGNSHKSQ